MNVGDLFDNAPCGCVVAHPDRRIAAVNATFARWLGCAPEDLLGREFTDLLSAGGRIHYETHFGPMLAMTGEFAGITVDLVAADGIRMPVFLTANAERADDGSAVFYRFVLQDARDRRSYERELLEARRQAEAERARAQVMTKTLQRSLVPSLLVPPEGLDAYAHYHAARDDEVSGDFYDVFPLSSRVWGFFLGDVCGKGAPAAALTSLTRYTLRAAAVINNDPVAVLNTLDAVLKQEAFGDGPSFCTVNFGVLRPCDGGFDVHLAGGGHPPPLLLTGDGQTRYLRVGGRAVGLPVEASFCAARIHLAPGDTMVLYTDGLTEARTGIGTERYDDDDALLRFAASHAPASAEAMVEAIRSLLARLAPGVDDDVAVLGLGVPRD